MEDIVAVAVELENGAQRYFLTWGRIQDPIDPRSLTDLVLSLSHRFALGGTAVKARLCGTLQEACKAPYFYECYFTMCQRRIPFGKYTYPHWRRTMNTKMHEGKEVSFLGNPDLEL